MPAITICPESKTDANKFNLTRVVQTLGNFDELSDQEEAGFDALSQVCDLLMHGNFETERNNVETLRELQNDFADHSETFILNVASSFKEHFQEVVTSEGICYTFNMLDYKNMYKKEMADNLQYPRHENKAEWSPFGYTTKNPDAYPTRVLGSGRKAGVIVKLKMRKRDVNYACKAGVNGYRLSLHSPDEFPRPEYHFHRIPFDTETTIAITPRVMSTSDNLKPYKPIKRQCYFPGEKRLQFFKRYSQSNCKLECSASKFYLKHFNNFKSLDFVLRFYFRTMWLCQVFDAS